MINSNGYWKHTYQNAVGRWAGIGPYYAMFPNEFAFRVISNYTEPDDWVLDPFAGRFSSTFAATAQGRNGVGIEINPVGWVYGQSKLHPVGKDKVERRLKEICSRARYFGVRSQEKLPDFFSHCYSPAVLSFLLAARNDLDWKNDQADTTLMSLILVFLHAKAGSGLSNQMRQSKAMAPDYSVRWWLKRDLKPPDLDPYSFMKSKIEWRYKQGIPSKCGNGIALLADCTIELERIVDKVQQGHLPKFRLLLTSPPYHNITNYHYDQWLRLWMLGGPNWPIKTEENYRGRFRSRVTYEELLDSVFCRVSKIMADNSTVYIRTDKRNFTLTTTRNILKRYFQSWDSHEIDRPIEGHSQTSLFGDFGQKPGEVDIILKR